MLTAMFRSCQV